MTSVLTSYAQRNTNLNEITPVYVTDISGFNLENVAIYRLNISKAHFTGGNFYVDLSKPDSSGNEINLTGRFYNTTDLSGEVYLPIVCFVLNIDINPSTYPGLEFSIFFKNNPTEDFPLTIGIISEEAPLPYIVSPPFPPIFGNAISPSITLKSDRDNFDVIASGPGGWLGVPALMSIMAVFFNILNL